MINYRSPIFRLNNSPLYQRVEQFAIVMPEFAERQSGRGINRDAEGRVVSIPHVTVFGIRHPVAVKPLDTRPDIRGKAQHVHHVGCRPDKLRRDRRWATHVRVTRRPNRNREYRLPESRTVDMRSKTAFACAVFDEKSHSHIWLLIGSVNYEVARWL